MALIIKSIIISCSNKKRERKMKKRFILLGAVLALSLSACGSKTTESNSTQESKATTNIDTTGFLVTSINADIQTADPYNPLMSYVD